MFILYMVVSNILLFIYIFFVCYVHYFCYSYNHMAGPLQHNKKKIETGRVSIYHIRTGIFITPNEKKK
jgi:hypothetical protein